MLLLPMHCQAALANILCQLATVCYNNGLAGLATSTAECLDLLNNIHPLGDTAKHDVLAIEPLSLDCAQEELQYSTEHSSTLCIARGPAAKGKGELVQSNLRAIGVCTSVCHGQDSCIKPATLFTPA